MGLRKVDLNATCVQECLVEVVACLLGLLIVLESHKAKLARPLILEHDLGVCDSASLAHKVIGQVHFFQVLWQVLHYQSTHFYFYFYRVHNYTLMGFWGFGVLGFWV